MTDSSSDMEYVEPCEPFHIQPALPESYLLTILIYLYCLTLV